MKLSKNAVIGTAGHVDHGKTSLIKALTGIDTDRLAEEKKRGITIETGYAHIDLPGGLRAGVADVPGHERFIKNMLAGAAGIDLAMLIVAADDGIMPQTREHLDILRLLGLKAGLVVVSKADLVDEEWLELVKDDISRMVQGTFLENAPIVAVSAVTGQGLDDLRAILSGLVSALTPHPVEPAFRLPLDRVFSMTGFGTVVTGTLMEGALKAGEMVSVYPDDITVKVRGLQVHSQAVETAWPGQRVAVNLNIKKDNLARGDVLATAGSLQPTLMLDVRLEILADSPFRIKSGSWVHLYLGSSELLAKVVLMEHDELAEGQSGFAQLRLMEPVTARVGDYFVLRFYSPVVTVGGGQILDPVPQKHRRHKPKVVEGFETKEGGSPQERLELLLKERPGTFPKLADLIMRAGLDPVFTGNWCRSMAQKGRVVALARDVYIHQEEMERLKILLKDMLSLWHKNNPYSAGMSLEEVRNRLVPSAPQTIADSLLDILENGKFIIRELGQVRLNAFKPQVNESENALIDKLDKIYLDFGLTPLVTSAVEPANSPAEERLRLAAFSSLVRLGKLVRLDNAYNIHKTFYDQAWEKFQELAGEKSVVQTGDFRDALNTSRKVAVALLEYFDNAGLTRPADDGRRLR
ncbi:selenocysteine-specific translation elongation factor [Deltaproteobacteria bacterium Smac51]|nr:selenocysteine-specific translation elongation factor [Deltaproteobacteria bacterium Smac51]